MSNRFSTDILIQAPDPEKAALFYVNHLGFEVTAEHLISAKPFLATVRMADHWPVISIGTGIAILACQVID
jgi:catechol 2,3-dioxygenase-like lactoylglutathione lyase family enzyme